MQTTQNENNTFDAIVVGSGISGGWAAKELCDKGLRTLVLERGRDVKHVQDYPTAFTPTWNLPNRNRIPYEEELKNPIVNRCYAYDEATKQFFVKDEEHPYVQEKPLDWIRGYQVGGKSLTWARQTQRWSKYEFDNPGKYGYSIDWPIKYNDIADWYSYVEKFVGISGNKDGLETLPDGEFLPPWEMNVVEEKFTDKVLESFPDRQFIIGRCAHLTEPQEIHKEQGRAQCQARHLCYRGCPYGAYFSSNASTLPWAEKTGNLTLKSDSVVHSIIYDDEQQKAIGVKVVDRLTKEERQYFAKIIFVNAATLNTNLLLLNSKSDRFPNGLGNDNDLLGRHVAFHNYRGVLLATYPGELDKTTFGRRPTMIMLPNFRNLNEQDVDFKGGYMTFVSADRKGWTRNPEGEQIGGDYKDQLAEPGAWGIYMMIQGETIPKYENHVRLSETERDEWGVPLLVTSVGYDDNDEKMLNDYFEQGRKMLEAAGCTDIVQQDSGQNPGLDIHIMGGARMGNDPKTSLLNKHNQLHACKNVFVTDGACMASTGVQNPSLTFMALTARAANFAVEEMKAGRL